MNKDISRQEESLPLRPHTSALIKTRRGPPVAPHTGAEQIQSGWEPEASGCHSAGALFRGDGGQPVPGLKEKPLFNYVL